VSNNQQGVAGINWYSKILPVRALGKCGGYSSDIVDGMRWAAGLSVPGAPENPNPARVINISLGGFGACLSSFQNAIDAIVARGSIVVAAAGNQQLDASLSQPGNCQNVITVGASTRGGDLAAYSNYGLALEVSAPGGDSKAAILSTANAGTTTPRADAYLVYMGTSMAAPHVAGIVSLMLSVDPCLTTTQITALLQNTLTPFHNPISCAPSRCGPGITNAGAAVAAARTGLATRTAANAVSRTTKLRPLTPFSIAVPGVFNGWSTSACYP
jgi:serine protease